MQLEPVYSDEVGKGVLSAKGQSTSKAVAVDSRTQQLVGIRVASVERASRTRTLRMSGRDMLDETRVYRLDTAVDGFVTETYGDTVGSPVKKGQRLANQESGPGRAASA